MGGCGVGVVEVPPPVLPQALSAKSARMRTLRPFRNALERNAFRPIKAVLLPYSLQCSHVSYADSFLPYGTMASVEHSACFEVTRSDHRRKFCTFPIYIR